MEQHAPGRPALHRFARSAEREHGQATRCEARAHNPDLGAVGSALRRERGLREAGSRPTKYPLVLVHGYFGFDVLKGPFGHYEYFRGLRAHLESLGHEVHVARMSPLGGIQTRAGQLAEQLEGLSARQVNVIAHSMGGLDARYALSRLGISRKVASLTTIGTPHWGTPLADRMAAAGRWLKRLFDVLGYGPDGLLDLTTEKMRDFNRVVLDAPGVAYASVAGSCSAVRSGLGALLGPSHAYVARCAGLNDGLVPASSQRWAKVLHEVDADHFAQVGWSARFDARSLYSGLAGALAARGL